jgi:hypothetical protein
VDYCKVQKKIGKLLLVRLIISDLDRYGRIALRIPDYRIMLNIPKYIEMDPGGRAGEARTPKIEAFRWFSSSFKYLFSLFDRVVSMGVPRRNHHRQPINPQSQRFHVCTHMSPR